MDIGLPLFVVAMVALCGLYAVLFVRRHRRNRQNLVHGVDGTTYIRNGDTFRVMATPTVVLAVEDVWANLPHATRVALLAQGVSPYPRYIYSVSGRAYKNNGGSTYTHGDSYVDIADIWPTLHPQTRAFLRSIELTPALPRMLYGQAHDDTPVTFDHVGDGVYERSQDGAPTTLVSLAEAWPELDADAQNALYGAELAPLGCMPSTLADSPRPPQFLEGVDGTSYQLRPGTAADPVYGKIKPDGNLDGHMSPAQIWHTLDDASQEALHAQGFLPNVPRRAILDG